MTRRRVLTTTSLYPSAARPRHGIFVETRLRELVRVADVDVRVIAPVPWFPSDAEVFGDYAQWARTPATETRHAIPVWHPRYLMVPKVGMRIQPAAVARAVDALLTRFERSGWTPDVIDAHYFYPDGVAAAQIAARRNIPLVITARGSDLNVIARLAAPRRDIVRAGQRAAAIVTVSEALAERCREIGIDGAKIAVLRNGVDASLFSPTDRATARRALRLSEQGPWFGGVGNLVPEKGFDLALAALAAIPEARLLIVGDGRERDALLRVAARLGVADRVVWRRPVPQQELAQVYSACDALVLTSTSEGWPNVILEALACGTPVVATDVGAVCQILDVPRIGKVVAGRDPEHLAAAMRACLVESDRAACRAHALRFGWEPVARTLAQLIERVIEQPARCEVRAA